MNLFPVAVMPSEPAASVVLSPLVLADRLITLAKEADCGGFVITADRLVHLANAIWDSGADAR